jgi:hypothetical protein
MLVRPTRRLRRSAAVAAVLTLAMGVYGAVVPPSQAQQVRAVCPYAFFYRNGYCYPFSWAGISGQHDADVSGLSW